MWSTHRGFHGCSLSWCEVSRLGLLRKANRIKWFSCTREISLRMMALSSTFDTGLELNGSAAACDGDHAELFLAHMLTCGAYHVQVPCLGSGGLHMRLCVRCELYP